MLQQIWTPSGKGCAVYLWSLPAWWWVQLREEPHLFCIAPAQHTALLEHQVPACRARAGCWTERTITVHVDSVGFCPAGEHCVSFEAWFFSFAAEPNGSPREKALPSGLWMRLSIKAKETPALGVLVKGAFQPRGIHILSAAAVWQETAFLCSWSKISHWTKSLGGWGWRWAGRREENSSFMYSVPTQKWLAYQ